MIGRTRSASADVYETAMQPAILILGLFLLVLSGAVLVMAFPRLPLRRD